jgi:hypothetical protein
MNMHTRLVALAAVLLLAPAAMPAQTTLGEGVTLSFASVAEGKRVLASRDDFVQRMSPFDRAARLKTDKDVSERQYLEFVGENVLPWNDVEKRKIGFAVQSVQEKLAEMALPFPEKVLILKTTGREEGGASYTRANAIVLPQAELEAPAAEIQKMICHELFHIMSRANPDLREKLYAAIGFAKCNEVAFPPELESRRITNPDAPRNDHCIRVKVAGRDQWAVPILFSRVEKYDVDRGGEFFDYLQVQVLLVEGPKESPAVKPAADGRKPKFVDLRQVSGFYEQVGKNTDYIIHPEEILADNFALLVLGQRDLPSPEIVEKIRAILKSKGTAAPSPAADADKPRR